MKVWVWVVGVVVLATGVAIAGAGSSGDDVASDLPRPSAAFCRAAGKYDETISGSNSTKLSLARHAEMTKAIADAAPKDVKADAELVHESFVKLAAGDRSVVDDPDVKDAVAHVNRRAGQDCGWFKREGL